MNIKSKILGYSIIELLIAIIIIGILVAILVPRLATRTEEARKKAAMSDLERIKDAEERAEVDTGFLYRLYVLDDVKGGDRIGSGQNGDVIDGIQDEDLNIINLNPTRFAIDPATGDFYDGFPSVMDKIKRNETEFNWQGPYLTWQKDYNGNDIPEDPWGNEYLFFTQKGLIDESIGDINPNVQYMIFDRFTVVSLGPNGVPGDPLAQIPTTKYGTGDDLMIQW